jgi:transcriptional regulator with XRE-family HTH domain
MFEAPPKQRHFIRQWRKYRGKTLEQVADHIHMTHQNLGKIERGQVPATDQLMEVLAELYSTDVASLHMRDPTKDDARWSVWDEVKGMTPKQAQRALRLVRAVKDAKAG